MPLTWNACRFGEILGRGLMLNCRHPCPGESSVLAQTHPRLRSRDLDHFTTKPEVEDKMINTAIDKLQALTGDKTLPEGEAARTL
jgi:hypothetical protein